ncbi:MAG: glycerol-3-phosphate dehydrogenase/oxidase [Winkia neuii]|uniref:glycerol-3-phosphate dehydrogenase/oxidase n=1 Tax=Winkia neuii TaxID=33007 RepID=UPI0028FE2221|nr:glycerol-3-phosphate dehydrogenase/oxidase [Winkia neuii]MDU3135536.1 glycerol-3-phosphate dehydrogenase/oxidase [Winkia neuii]
MVDSQLNAHSREQAIAQMSAGKIFDVLVIGGGINGAGIALEAASRGLQVCLVEAQDWGEGTSSRTKGIIHGGISWLENNQLRQIAKVANERGILLQKTAPHLVKLMPFIWPIEKGLKGRIRQLGIAFLHDMIIRAGVRGAVPPPRACGVKEAVRAFPSFAKSPSAGALRFFDAVVTDTRLVIAVLRTARQYGAVVASHLQATKILRDASQKVNGAQVVDQLQPDRQFRIRARHTVLATGPWVASSSLQMSPDLADKVHLEKGINIAVPRQAIRGSTGVCLSSGGHLLSLVPRRTHWIIGTDYRAFAGDKAKPPVSEQEIAALLEQVNEHLAVPLRRDQVVAAWAGGRHLIADRDHPQGEPMRWPHILDVGSGITAIFGGAMTLYRLTAERTVDQILAHLGKWQPSRTAKLPLVGAAGYTKLWNTRYSVAANSGIDSVHVASLLNRYGDEAEMLLAKIRTDPQMGQTIPGAQERLKVEIFWALQAEGALTLTDVIERRLMLGRRHQDDGKEAAPAIAEVVADVCGWDSAKKEAELNSFFARH